MTHSIGIVAHRDRQGMALELSEQVDADVISIDPGNLGCDTNHRIVWRNLLDSEAQWLVVLEDDAVPVEDFNSQLDDMLLASPSNVVGLYLGRMRPPQYQPQLLEATQQADDADAHWIISKHCLNAVGIAIRYSLVPEMLANSQAYLPIDQAIGRWLRTKGHTIAYAWPSPLDHADLPTLVQHPDGRDRRPGRVAWRTGTRDHWTPVSVDL